MPELVPVPGMMIMIIAVMIEIPAVEICLVLFFEPGLVVLVILLVLVMSVPFWIGVVRMTGIIPFEVDVDMYLRIRGVDGETSGNNEY
jgi:hypothetical protein